MGSTTWKRTLKQTLIAEYNVVLMPSCGSLKNSHTPKKNSNSSHELLAEQRCNQQQPNTDVDTKTGDSTQAAGCCC